MRKHLYLVSIKPTKRKPNRRWRCKDCGAKGSLEELRKTECSCEPEPCKYCGESPECSKDCPAMLAALSHPSIRVIGTPDKS